MKKIILFLLLTISLFGEAYHIVVDVNHCKLLLMQENKVIHEYSVGVIKPGLPIPQDGYITKVDLNPTWYPTQRTKDFFRDVHHIILPSAVPAGDKNNYMGTFKITMSNFTESRGAVYRIHGNIDDSKIGTRCSGGCVRMHNSEGKMFAQNIKDLLKQGEKIKVHYEV